MTVALLTIGLAVFSVVFLLSRWPSTPKDSS